MNSYVATTNGKIINIDKTIKNNNIIKANKESRTEKEY